MDSVLVVLPPQTELSLLTLSAQLFPYEKIGKKSIQFHITATNSCAKPRAPRHGTKRGRSYTLGSVVTIVCDAGYKVSGTAKIFCQENGQWSGIEPECSRE